MPAARPTHPARPATAARPARTRAVAARRPAPALLTALLAALCALGLTAVLAVVAATPAHAHDRLTGSEPADGAQLDAPPGAITLTFNTEPLEVEPQVVVTDSAGTVVAEGAPTIAGPTATLPLDTATLGGDSYTVAWRVVSSDGHPIEGTFGFAVAEPAQAAPPAAEDTGDDATDDATASAGPSADASSSAADATTPADDLTADGAAAGEAEEGGSALPLVLGIVVALVVVAGVVTVLVLRRRGDGPTGAPQPPGLTDRLGTGRRARRPGSRATRRRHDHRLPPRHGASQGHL
ncbi:copper resistance CopC family protein [Cellulosimicrobium sp. CUA-896]|uniref:copper resistance CopC family protein n=1 Tax=Cellulosimicrobium sp. CUA-896 TaxID=1517881 RepID=UPI00096172E0|nr:copper resistance CopC family protein [Cellulosimicrobium sp. CUA-896]OLT52621.1 hypothetical protein BJF88_13440 [Cellulosimicrobium sp. CUA-896]